MRSNMRAELSLVLTSSPIDDISAEYGAKFFNLQTIIPSAQEPQIVPGTSLARKRRTKAQINDLIQSKSSIH